MVTLSEAAEALLQIFFPHVCSGCGSDRLDLRTSLCLHCLTTLPETGFETVADNPVEKKFWGRLPIEAATAAYYFTRDSVIQRLIHQLKYRGDKAIGIELGKLMGEKLLSSGRFQVDALIPLPLFPSRERKRGYNQARLLCEGMAAVLPCPLWDDVIIRHSPTTTQTHHKRIERWDNMKGRFTLKEQGKVMGKHLLLVDDVITTGATLEACGTELLNGDRVKLSIASLCFANR